MLKFKADLEKREAAEKQAQAGGEGFGGFGGFGGDQQEGVEEEEEEGEQETVRNMSCRKIMYNTCTFASIHVHVCIIIIVIHYLQYMYIHLYNVVVDVYTVVDNLMLILLLVASCLSFFLSRRCPVVVLLFTAPLLMWQGKIRAH